MIKEKYVIMKKGEIMDDEQTKPENTFGEEKYAGFFIRAFAGLLDWLFSILFFSLMIFLLRLFVTEMPQKIYWVIPSVVGILIQFIYNITIPQFFGGTLGKLILKMRILKLDYQEIGFKESFLRYSIVLIWVLFNGIVLIIGIVSTPNELYEGFKTYSEWSNYLKTIEPKFTIVTTIAINVWIFSEYIVLLLNKKKRGLQDYMAGTIVVKIN